MASDRGLFEESGRYGEAEGAYAVALQEKPEAASTWYIRANNQLAVVGSGADCQAF